MKNKKKIIIIGAGPGGLTAAMILLQRGFDVQIFEKNDRIGGRNQKIELDEFKFDTGPTFLMMSFILKEMFKEAGENIEDHLDLRKIEPMYHLDFGDVQMNPTTDIIAMKEEINRLFPGNEKGLEKFYETEKHRFELLFPCLQKDYSNFRTFFSKDFLRAIPILGVGKSLFENLGNYFNSEKLKLSFTFQSKYLGMSPWECPAGFTIIPFIEHAYGIYHVIGGLNQISEAMAKIIKNKGGKIHLSRAVKKIITENKKATGIELENGEKFFADEIIINSDFAYSMSNIVPKEDIKKYTRENLEKKKYSCSTFMLYLGLKKKYDIPHHNIFFAKDYKKNIEQIFNTKKISKDTSFYIQNASVTDPTLAPEGKSALYILVPVANNFSKIDWAKQKQSFRNLVLQKVVERTSMKDLLENIEQEKIITPAEWEKDYNVYKGATFNLAHNLSQMLYFRPRNKFEELDNCYLVGGGTHPGSGLPTIYESARISANLLCKKYGVKYRKASPIKEKEMMEKPGEPSYAESL